MLVLPRIDLRRGRCVRLPQGNLPLKAMFSDNPLVMAAYWADEGATWLHVVDMDGAGASRDAARGIVQMMAARGVTGQVGGGLHTVEDVAEVLGWGVARVILGSATPHNPTIVAESLARFGAERVVIALNARQGWVVSDGAQQPGDLPVLEVAQSMKTLGVTRLLYADIERDGSDGGPNIAKIGELAQRTGLRLLVSGSVSTLDHLRQLRWIEPYGVEGVIVGHALDEGWFTVRDALDTVGN